MSAGYQEFPPGARVVWDDADPDDPAGTVVAPTQEELAYVATWTSAARADVKHKVIVQWDGEERWDCGWHDPGELVKAVES